MQPIPAYDSIDDNGRVVQLRQGWPHYGRGAKVTALDTVLPFGRHLFRKRCGEDASTCESKHAHYHLWSGRRRAVEPVDGGLHAAGYGCDVLPSSESGSNQPHWIAC